MNSEFCDILIQIINIWKQLLTGTTGHCLTNMFQTYLIMKVDLLTKESELQRYGTGGLKYLLNINFLSETDFLNDEKNCSYSYEISPVENGRKNWNLKNANENFKSIFR